MINTVFHDTDKQFEWIDVLNPDQNDYKILSEKYGLHPAAVKDCMAPMHLPKFEEIEDVLFIIARVYDVNAKDDSDNIQSLTNKIAVFISDSFMITIHRKEEPFFVELREKWRNTYQNQEYEHSHLVNQLLYRIIHTFDGAMNKAAEQLDEYERQIFTMEKNSDLIRSLYMIKRKASVFKRMISLTKDTIYKFEKVSGSNDPFIRDLTENIDSVYFTADELHENVNNLLNLHLALAAHRTNEVMSVLTVFSVFFMPLTFIVGLYGMNFKFMPELDSEIGYPTVILVMLFVILVTYIWFKRKSFL